MERNLIDMQTGRTIVWFQISLPWLDASLVFALSKPHTELTLWYEKIIIEFPLFQRGNIAVNKFNKSLEKRNNKIHDIFTYGQNC